MRYSEIPLKAITGDLLATSNNHFIRILTGESYSHVATLLWDEGRLMVYETTGMRGGFRAIPFAQWIKEHQHKKISFGVAPAQVHFRADLVAERMLAHRDSGPHLYGWTALPLIWLSQLTKKKYGQWHRACSSLSQYFWNASGWTLCYLADPGSIMREAIIFPVEV